MCGLVCVCVCVFLSACSYVTCYVCMCVYVCIYMYELKLVHRYICVHACICTCIFEIMPISLYIYIYVCVCIYILMEMFFLLFLCLYMCYIYFVIILFYMEEIKKSIYLSIGLYWADAKTYLSLCYTDRQVCLVLRCSGSFIYTVNSHISKIDISKYPLISKNIVGRIP